MHGFKEVVCCCFLRGKGGGGEVKNHSGGLGYALQKSGPLRLQKCVLASYYGTQHSCLENLINSAHHNTRKMVPIKKRVSSFPITVCRPA